LNRQLRRKKVSAGRVEIEKDYADEFDGVYKNAMLKDESDKVAILDADHVITGRADGTISVSLSSDVLPMDPFLNRKSCGGARSLRRLPPQQT